VANKGKYIVFDWNGTLFDDTHVVLESLNAHISHHGHAAVDIDTLRAHYDTPPKIYYRNLGFTEAEAERLHNSGHLFNAHYESRTATLGLRAGSTEILTDLQKAGTKALILSNHIADAIRDQLKRLDIEHFFKDVLAFPNIALQYRDITKGERLRRHMQGYKFTPLNAVIVGDTVEEIEIGREQGLTSVAITGGMISEARLRAAKPDYLVHSLQELRPILQEREMLS